MTGSMNVLANSDQPRLLDTRTQSLSDVLLRLNELSSRLWSTRSRHDGLEELLAATIELLDADFGTLRLLDASRNVLLIEAERGFQAEFLDFFREIPGTEDSRCGQALRHGERIIIEDVETDPDLAPVLHIVRRAGFRAAQSTPVVGRDGRPLGLISTHFRTVHRPSPHELRLLDLYARLCADFIERCESDEQLLASEQALRQADRRKDEFLAILAHELRGPLAPLRNMLEVIKRADGNADLLRQARDTMERQLGHLVRLVDDLLDVSRISKGKFELKRERVDLSSVVYRAVEANRPLAECARHVVHVVLPSEPIYLNGDPVRLMQVFGNLLNNACKYSDPGGRINLTAEQQEGEVLVKVEDAGVGIPPEKLSSLFDMFSQVDSTVGRSQGGLGIGLSIVKRLVEMHEGTVEAKSEGPGRGSEFVVRLPLPRQDNPHDGGRHG